MRRLLCCLALTGSAALGLPVIAQAATTTSFTVVNGATGLPLANQPVTVYYMPPNEADDTTADLPVLGSGTTDSNGAVSMTLKTGQVDQANLGDVGDGTNDAFNAMVVSDDGNGYLGVTEEVLTLGGSLTDTLQATSDATLVANGSINMTNPGGPIQYPDGLNYSTDTYCSPACKPDKTVWPKVMIENVASGVTGTFDYTQGYATQGGVATTLNCGINVNWCSLGSMAMEEDARSSYDEISHTGGFHYNINASYTDREHQYRSTHNGYSKSWYEWRLLHWNGDLGHPVEGLGVYSTYNPPAFVAGNSAVLGVGETKGRHTGQTQVFGASFNIQGISLSSKAQYTSNTDMKWTGVSGACTGGIRYLWGQATYWPYADIVQNSCIN